MFVIDASAVIPVLVPEALSTHAQILMGRAEPNNPALAPLLLSAEIANAMLKRVRRGQASPDEARTLFSAFDRLPIQLVREDLHQEALHIALRYNLPAAYDAHYLALAERLGCDFWTADERLVNALAGALPGVRWLGSIAAR